MLRPIVHGRRIILAVGSLTDARGWVKQLEGLGALPPFILAESIGAGVVPTWPDVRYRILGCRGARDQLEAFRRYRDALRDPPIAVRKEIAQYDPAGRALVLVRAQHQCNTVAGRDVFAPRLEAWKELEDKTTVDAIWSAVGIPQAPFRVVAPTLSELMQASAELERGDGVVWSGDYREGYNSGGDFVRFVNDEHKALLAQSFFVKHCSRVRIMPFLNGLPCSVHGMVFPDCVVVFRPVELVVLRERKGVKFRYAGNATWWDPAPSCRDEIRRVARMVGEHLREMVKYRGIFTVDGVLTADGFRPTELNPRTGAALWTLASCLPGLPISLLEMVVRRGLDLDYKPEELEDLVVKAADRKRKCVAWSMVRNALPNECRAIASGNQGFHFAREDDVPVARLETGTSGVGGVVRASFTNKLYRRGHPVSATVVEMLQFLDRELGTGFGDLVAPSVA